MIDLLLSFDLLLEAFSQTRSKLKTLFSVLSPETAIDPKSARHTGIKLVQQAKTSPYLHFLSI